MIAILGSGFGLYGYLPALVGGCGQRVVLPQKSRAPFEKRKELSGFAGDIEWARDEEAALDRAEGAVVALPPAAQADWIPRCLARAPLQRVLLEKPLASSPKLAAALSRDLAGSGKVVRMGYTFRFTDWGRQLRQSLGEDGALTIEWSFLAHHFREHLQNWKRTTATGGGALRFYGIQLIALLAELGYREVISSRSSGASENEIEKWSATLTGAGVPECKLAIDTRAALERFRVDGIVDRSDPFPGRELLDRRVPVLTSLCRTLWEADAGEAARDQAAIELWQRIEEQTKFQPPNDR